MSGTDGDDESSDYRRYAPRRLRDPMPASSADRPADTNEHLDSVSSRTPQTGAQPPASVGPNIIREAVDGCWERTPCRRKGAAARIAIGFSLLLPPAAPLAVDSKM
jgi:hypothetical protein